MQLAFSQASIVPIIKVCRLRHLLKTVPMRNIPPFMIRREQRIKQTLALDIGKLHFAISLVQHFLHHVYSPSIYTHA